MLIRRLNTLLATLVAFSSYEVLADGSAEVSLDGEWDFAWTPPVGDDVPTIPTAGVFEVSVRVPGRWDDQLDRFTSASWWKDAQFTTTMGPVRYLTGIGWYRRTINVPAAWHDRAVRLTIGWAVGQVHVWLNAQHIGRYDYAVYTPFTVDLTNHLICGQKNELVISVDNTRGFAGGWAFIGNAGKASGITRPVKLTVAAGTGQITDLYVRPGKDLKELLSQIKLDVPAGDQKAPASKLRWQVTDTGGQTVLASGGVDVPAFDRSRQVAWKASIDAIRPWCPKSPNLYRIEVRWGTNDETLWDTHSQRFGLRRWSYEGRKLKLNGRDIYLRGDFGAYYYPVHCTTPTTKDYWVGYIRRAKQIGMNYINFAARVCPVELMEAADELGIVLQCGDHMTVLKQHRDTYKDVWTPIVRLTRKYPSMGIYGFGGEHDYYEGIIEQYQKQHDLIKSLHPESLVMPQQAIRGIDYAFDEKSRKELTREPFPHHAERLARYTKACDIFGHYSSGGAFGYNYFSVPWQEMQRRFLIYHRPLSMHELFMGMSYLNPDNAARYTGRVPPYLYTKLRDDLTDVGLIDRWPVYYENSSRLQGICRKYCLEKTRKCNELHGFEFLGMTDMHHTEHYTTGILDEFLQLKPGNTIEGILRYNGESVLLIDYPDGSINRCYWTGTPFEANIMVSHYGDDPIRNGTLRWALQSGDTIALEGTFAISEIPTGRVGTLRTLKLTWPLVEQTTRFNLSLQLTGSGTELANDWDFWVFPTATAPSVVADADEKTFVLLAGRYKGLRKLDDALSGKLRIVSQLNEAEIQLLGDGGDVLLLGAKPFAECTFWTSFRPGLGGREHHNVGTVIAQHPIFRGLPHEGWADWQFYPVLEGASCILFEDSPQTPFDPILEIISSAEDVRKQAALLEKQVSKGRLLVSTCVFRPDNPSCVALMDGILQYMQSDAFRPKSELSPVVLLNPTRPIDPGDTHRQSAVATSAEAKAPESWPSVKWHREPVTLDLGADGWYRVNEGAWAHGRTVRVAQEGVNKIAVRRKRGETSAEIREVRIDTTPPVITLATKPAIEQAAGVYFATPDTAFIIKAEDNLSGVAAIEVSIDGESQVPYRTPLKLSRGRHEVRCRATDVAGNRSETITGQALSGGKAEALIVQVQ